MPITKYTKWRGSLLDSLNLEDLVDELSQFFLQSGFPNDPWGNSWDDAQQDLRQTIVEKLVEMGHIPQQMMDNWLDNPESDEARQIDEIVSQLIRRMVEEGWLRTEQREHPMKGGRARKAIPPDRRASN
jgi:Ca-activated chloride channel homolog